MNRTLPLIAAVLCLMHAVPAGGQTPGELRRAAEARAAMGVGDGGLPARNFRTLGAVSCAAGSCHGGPRPGVAQPRAARGSEYPLWHEQDPHARSWRTLCSDASLQMMERLGIFRDGELINQGGFDNCLACHHTPANEGPSRESSSLGEGVGCESCHGPAEVWSGLHYQDGWNAALAQQVGFTRTDDLFTRARTCAGCHVGDSDRDMNHDLIAAGHPALRFEMATYHNRQPKHWREPASQNRGHFEAQLWLAGQLAAADASLALLESRASGRLAVNQWPELAEYDCASCHHSLQLADPQRRNGRSEQTRLRIAAWNRTGLESLLQTTAFPPDADAAAERLLHRMDQLQALLQGDLHPDAVATAQAARSTRAALSEWASAVRRLGWLESFSADQLTQLVAAVAATPAAADSWEDAAQLYLAAVAGRARWQRMPPARADKIEIQLRKIRHGLAYPPGHQGPRFLAFERSAVPAESGDVRNAFQALAETLRAAPRGASPELLDTPLGLSSGSASQAAAQPLRSSVAN